MDAQNTLNPLDPYCDRNSAMLIDKLVGNAYETVKHVARNIDAIKHVSANLEAIYAVAQAITTLTDLINNATFTSIFRVAEVACTPDCVFDLNLGSTQELVLVADVPSPQLANISTCSSLIVFRFIQDGIGGRVFTWPDAIRSHGDIDLTPNAVSQQMFAKNPDDTFDFINPMMYPRG